jgi:metallophosphoesterase (TIGR00282 family)
MNILYVGDVMGETGLKVVGRILPELRRDKKIDLVIAQAENVSGGKGITPEDFAQLRGTGVDFATGGNWSLHREEIVPALNDPKQPIIRPANYPAGTPGLGYKYAGDVLVISLLGKIVGKDKDNPVDNPLKVVDGILKEEKPKLAVVNFHGDYSSEKVIIGHYLDGRVSAVIGDHWHVPTADARVLPGGTAHITDVGMCGALDASLGVTYRSVLPRWLDGTATRNVLETEGPTQFNAVLVSIGKEGRAEKIEQIQTVSR